MTVRERLRLMQEIRERNNQRVHAYTEKARKTAFRSLSRKPMGNIFRKRKRP